MKNKKIRLLCLMLLLFTVIFTSTTYAWMISVKNIPSISFGTSVLKYQLQGAFNDSSYIVPGEELITTPFVLINSSTVPSELRVKITYEYVLNESPESELFTSLNLDSSSNKVMMGVVDNKWKYLSDYWYYEGVEVSSDGKYIIPASNVTPTTLDLLSSLSYKGNKVGNDYQMNSLKVVLKFDAKQAKNVTWDEITTLSIVII